ASDGVYNGALQFPTTLTVGQSATMRWTGSPHTCPSGRSQRDLLLDRTWVVWQAPERLRRRRQRRGSRNLRRGDRALCFPRRGQERRKIDQSNRPRETGQYV